jgi:hypothetical protein
MPEETLPHNVGTWRISEKVCALADSERHLGHILKFGSQWLACDATRVGESGSGLWIIGIFPDIASAKSAVELASVRMTAGPRGATGVM